MKIKKKSFKYLREGEFGQIKAILDVGVPFSKVIALTGRSWGTVIRIKKATSFAQYKHLTRQTVKKLVKKEAGEVSSDTTALLKEISANLLKLIAAVEKKKIANSASGGAVLY